MGRELLHCQQQHRAATLELRRHQLRGACRYVSGQRWWYHEATAAVAGCCAGWMPCTSACCPAPPTTMVPAAPRSAPTPAPSLTPPYPSLTSACLQVLILLETEETVEQPWRRQVQGGGGGSGANGGSAIRRVYDEHLEVTADTACTHFLFTIPPDAAATFQTPLLQLRWLLRFQFTASLPAVGGGPAGGDWSPLQGRVEQLTWALPVTVLPPSA